MHGRTWRRKPNPQSQRLPPHCPFSRLIEQLVLGLLIAVLAVLLTYLFLLKQYETSTDAEMYYSVLGGAFVILPLSVILYPVLMEASAWQATLGKRAMHIIVVDLDGQRLTMQRAFIRNFTKLFSGFFFYIGYLMVLWTERKQGLHDMLAGAYVVKGYRE